MSFPAGNPDISMPANEGEKAPTQKEYGADQLSSVSLPAALTRGSDSHFRYMIDDLLGVAAALQAIREAFGEIAGVSGPQYSILMTLVLLERSVSHVTVSRVADHLHVSGTFVTAETNKLQRRGYLRKSANPADRRSILLSLTRTGRSMLEKLMPAVREVNDEIFRSFGRDEFANLRGRIAELASSSRSALLIARSRQRQRNDRS